MQSSEARMGQNAIAEMSLNLSLFARQRVFTRLQQPTIAIVVSRRPQLVKSPSSRAWPIRTVHARVLESIAPARRRILRGRILLVVDEHELAEAQR